MPVVNTLPFYFVPILRGKQPSDGMVARWHGVATSTGDASAGRMETGIYFGAEASAIYGGRLLWDLKTYTYEVSGAIANAQLIIETGERTSYPIIGGAGFRLALGSTAPMSANSYRDIPFKWRVSNLPSELTRVYIDTPNVNALSMTIYFAGYIYDEALI